MLTALWEDIHKSWITGRVYLKIEILNEWEKKEHPNQTKNEGMTKCQISDMINICLYQNNRYIQIRETIMLLRSG